jgi:integrase
MPKLIDAPTATKTEKPPFPGRNGKFTDAAMLRIKPPADKDRPWYYSETLRDGVALECVIWAGGRIKWRACLFNGSRPTREKVGTFPAMTCDQARDAVLNVFKGKTPAQLEREKREREAGTFGAVAQEWFNARVEGKIRTSREVARVLSKDLAAWDRTPFASIRRADVNALLKPLPDAMANHVLSILKAIFTYKQPDMPEDYQVPIIDAMRRTGLKARERVLVKRQQLDDDTWTIDASELRQVWQAASDGSEFGRFIQFLTLTAQRRCCVAEMRWSDIKGNTWTPREYDGPGSAKGVPSSIKLPPRAVRILNEQRQLRGEGNGDVWNVAAFSWLKSNFDKRCPISPRWTLHDLRRTARTLMGLIKTADGKRAINDVDAEACLGHAVRVSSVQGVYDQAGDDPVAIAAALAILAEHVCRLVGENVIELSAKVA